MRQEKQKIVAATIVGNLHREGTLEEAISKLQSEANEAFLSTEYFTNWPKVVANELQKRHGDLMVESFVLSGHDFDLDIPSFLTTLLALIDEFREIYKNDINKFYKSHADLEMFEE